MKSIPLRVSRLSALASLLSAATLPVWAQTGGPNKLDSVFVTATRSPQRLADVLADVTVLTRADIERQAFGGIADLLRNNGCAEMTRNGGPAANASLFLRGADTRHTLVLIDGMRVDSQATGGASWQALPLSQIERIEVLKGPASAIYGSDAVGGVVHIFTRKSGTGGNKLSLDLGAAVGNLGTQKLDGGIFGTIGPNGMFDFAVSAAGERSNGFNATLDVPGSFSYVPDRDGYRNHNASVRLGAQLSREHRVEVMGLQSHVNGQYDGSKSKPLIDDHSLQDTKAASANWSALWGQVGLPALQTQLTLGQSSERYQTKPSPYLTETTLRNTSLNGSYEFSKTQQLNFVLERRDDELQNSGLTTANGTDKRNQNALALGYLWSVGPLRLQAHARHDDDSQFGGVDTGTLAAGYLLSPGLRLVGSAGTAFRAPTLYQRGSVYGPDLTKAGVAPLAPEHGRNLEFGLKFNVGMSDAAITAYRNRVTNLIIFGAAGTCQSSFGCYQNVSEALLQGLSISGGTQFGHGLGSTRLSATLDLQAPKDASTGKLLARRARQYGTVRADTQFANLANWNFGVGVQASGQRYDNAANTKPLAGYALLNLDAQYAINRELKLQFNLDNAFDRAYQTAGGYAQAPRTVMLGLRYSPSL